MLKTIEWSLDLTKKNQMETPRLNLREKQNSGCLSCDRASRKDLLDDGLCTRTVSILDQLQVRCVGDWAYKKIYRLVKYFGIFAQGMKSCWRGLNYVEICSGPGRCITRGDRNEIDGTALSIISHPVFPQLKKALFIDANPNVVDVLNQRIAAFTASEHAEAVVGNYEDIPGLKRLLDQLPAQCLNLVFIDPTECNVPFQAIKTIVHSLKNVDLIVNVAVGTDANRNLQPAILDPSFLKARSKYENFLGSPGFCTRLEVIQMARADKFDGLRHLFIEEYIKSLNAEGYAHTDLRPVEHYYYLVFASRNPKGLECLEQSMQYRPRQSTRVVVNLE